MSDNISVVFPYVGSGTSEGLLNAVIVLPTYNEAQNIESLIGQVLALYPEIRIIVVDDNSPDGTGKIVDELLLGESRISVIHREGKLGLGSAYVEGFRKALTEGADLILEMDADFSHDPKYIKDLLGLSENYDLVIGSRYMNGVRVEGWRFRRLLMSKFANMFVSYVTARPLWDFTAGFRCYRRCVLETIDLSKVRSDGYAFQIEMTHLAYEHGFSVVETPIIFKERVHGASKISGNVIWEAFWLTLRCRASIIDMARRITFLFRGYEEFVDYKNSGEKAQRSSESGSLSIGLTGRKADHPDKLRKIANDH